METLFGSQKVLDVLTHPALKKQFLESEDGFKSFIEGFFAEALEIWDIFDHRAGCEVEFWANIPAPAEIRGQITKMRGLLLNYKRLT